MTDGIAQFVTAVGCFGLGLSCVVVSDGGTDCQIAVIYWPAVGGGGGGGVKLWYLELSIYSHWGFFLEKTFLLKWTAKVQRYFLDIFQGRVSITQGPFLYVGRRKDRGATQTRVGWVTGAISQWRAPTWGSGGLGTHGWVGAVPGARGMGGGRGVVKEGG